MPKYEYLCKSCGERIEVKQSFVDDPLTECPTCGGVLRKVFSSPGIVLRGPGFYRTDHRSPYRPDGTRPAERDKDREASEAKSGSEGKEGKDAKDAKDTGSESKAGSDAKDKGSDAKSSDSKGGDSKDRESRGAGSDSGRSESGSGASSGGSSGDTGGSKDAARTA